MATIKLRRPRDQWADPDNPEYYESYYMKIRWRGRQILRKTGETVKARAEAIERKLVAELNGERWEAVFALLEDSKLRRTGATVGEVIAAYMAPGVRILKSEKQARRNVNDLRNVIAYAKDLWTKHTGGVRGIKIGAEIADVAKIDALPASILTKDLVRSYFSARQGGEIDWNEPDDDNGIINSMLGHARDVFGKAAMELKLDKLRLPDVSGFRTFPLLPEESPEAHPLTPDEFAAMVAAAHEVQAAEPELWLVNVLLRRTGLRSSYLLAAKSSWLEREGDRWHLAIRNRKDEGFRKKRGTRDQAIPLDDELAAVLTARDGFLVLPAGTAGERDDLVRRRHNAWLKSQIGGLGETTQGNHRLRDTVASALWTLYGSAAAQEALGHASADTTAKHYAKRLTSVNEVMRQELAAWAPRGGKIIPMAS
jgi:integrase